MAFIVSSSLTEITREHGERQTTQTHTDEEAQAWSQMEKGTRGLDERAAKQRECMHVYRDREITENGAGTQFPPTPSSVHHRVLLVTAPSANRPVAYCRLLSKTDSPSRGSRTEPKQ